MKRTINLAVALALLAAPALAQVARTATGTGPSNAHNSLNQNQAPLPSYMVLGGTGACVVGDTGCNLPISGGAVTIAPYVYTPLGCGQLASFSTATLLSSVSGGIPAGATLASLSVELNAVRYRDDGTAPTAGIGTPLSVATMAWPYTASLGSIQFIPETGSATVDVCFYK